MEDNNEMLVRRKRINENGDWEYECSECEIWLPKERFRGCKNYVDAYGNCLMCSGCRACKSTKTRIDSEEESVKEILTAIGFYKYPNAEAWYEAKLKQYGKEKPTRKNNRGMRNDLYL